MGVFRLLAAAVRKLLHGIAFVGNNVLLLATYIVLGVLYSPARLFDPLRKRLGRDETYWVERRPVADDLDRHYHPF